MTSRIKDRIEKEIPPTQAAYRSSRCTTEHVFPLKLAVERTLTSKDETLYLILLDMSNVSDSINRKLLLQDLRKIINGDELHIIRLLLNVKLEVRGGKEFSEPFTTNTGAPKGDCSSTSQFTFYLAKTLENYYNQKVYQPEHDYALRTAINVPIHMKELDYAQGTLPQHLEINLEYVDDISVATTNHAEIENLTQQMPVILNPRDLIVNNTKTEEYTVRQNTNEWKKCKLLRSYVDTKTDIKNRKGKLFNAANQLKEIFMHRRLPYSTKVKAFNTYLTTIFLYNSELWTLTETMVKSFDAFQRKVLRIYVLNVKYPKVISNEEVYRRTGITPWSTVIEKRRLKWLGHCSRLDKDTQQLKQCSMVPVSTKREGEDHN